MDPKTTYQSDDDAIDLGELFKRLLRGIPVTLGLSLLGLVFGAVLALALAYVRPDSSTLRLAFSFPGFERGNYPNGSHFSTDDLRAPDVVNEVVNQAGLPDTQSLALKVRGAITINGIVPDSIVKQRDRLRAAGQTPPDYVPDEYAITLDLGRNLKLDAAQREHLLTGIINAYTAKFQRTYITLPPEFNNPFNSLRDADYPEYELVLNREMDALLAFLKAQNAKADNFRSPTNGLSFQSLITQAQLFSRVRLNNVLSVIYANGLSKNRTVAMTKMDYYLRTLEDQEQRLTQQQSVVTDLLKQAGDRAQNYVLASKTQLASDKPVLDQGLINSLVANDAYNLLIRKALDAGAALKDLQAEKARLLERKSRLESFASGTVENQSAAMAQVQTALAGVESDYAKLVADVRTVLNDFTAQEYAHAIRITQPPVTKPWWRALAMDALIGLFLGGALGLGLSLLKQPSPRD